MCGPPPISTAVLYLGTDAKYYMAVDSEYFEEQRVVIATAVQKTRFNDLHKKIIGNRTVALAIDYYLAEDDVIYLQLKDTEFPLMKLETIGEITEDAFNELKPNLTEIARWDDEDWEEINEHLLEED